MGAQYDRSAPWNEPTRRTVWWEYYVLTGVGEDEVRQFEVYFPADQDDYDLNLLAKSFCKDNGLCFVGLCDRADKRVMTCLTEVYYE